MSTPAGRQHVTVGICSYKRPSMLKRLLTELGNQQTQEGFSFSAVVVDNDSGGSARVPVEEAAPRLPFPIRYVPEAEKNISLARNKALESAQGEFLAFIDDDEFPDGRWLWELVETAGRHSADAVLGPVLPYCPAPPPRWIVRSRVLERTSFETGTRMTDPKFTRTGNALIRLEAIRRLRLSFDPQYGITGGEDVDLFGKMIAGGGRIVWCNEAVVYEEVPAERYSRAYHLRRALLRGSVASRRHKATPLAGAKSSVAILAYGLLIPVLFIFPVRHYMRFLVKSMDHLGKLLGYLKIFPVKER
jgi:succinoglycan biosynthesis protein ExoM